MRQLRFVRSWGLVAFAISASLLLQSAVLLGDDAGAKTDQDKIQGTWTLHLKPHDVTVVFDGNKLYWIENGKRTNPVTIKLNSSANPKEIDETDDAGDEAGNVRKAIYELDGDTLKIAFPSTFNGERPKDFTHSVIVQTYTRQK